MPKPLPTFDGSVCPSCVHRDQFRRHLHFLKDFRTRPDLEKHLTWSLPASRKGREFHEDQLVGILQWVESIQQLYEKQSDTNGTPLEAWEAWCMQQAWQTIPTKAALHHRLRELGMPTGWMLETVAVAPDEDGDMEETTVPF